MSETICPPVLKMKLSWESAAEEQPRTFETWMQQFENWFALQNALFPDAQKLSATLKCQSLVQHLGAGGRSHLTTCFGGEIPAKLNMDYGTLNAVLSSSFAEEPHFWIARHCFFARKQEPLETIADIVNALQTLAEHCDFGTIKDDLLASQFCRGCYKENVCLKLLQ